MKLSRLTLALMVSGMASSAYAQQANDDAIQGEEQNTPAETVERVEVTGSSIKRAGIDGALPLTIISKADIDQAGITNVDQLMLNLNIGANSNDNLASNAGIVGGEERGNNGASSANLRGQGRDSTLVLLNGRRVATHGIQGRAVDLNSIPFNAIERVEVLRDGASAVYGTDAIGGVINFILKKNYEGAEVTAFADHTEEGSGNIYKINLLGGTGDLYDDGYNLMASVSYNKAEILRGTDRDFTNTFQAERGLSPDTRGAPFASLNDRWNNPNDPNGAHYNLIGDGLIDPATGLEQTVLNVLALPTNDYECADGGAGMGDDAPALWNRENEQFSCSWDYPRASVLQQPVETLNLVSRGTMLFDSGDEIFAEVVGSHVTTNKVFEPNQITPWAIRGTDDATGQDFDGWYPSTGASYDYVADQLAAYFGEDQINRGAPISYRWRCVECGPREIETTTKAYRLLLGAEGTLFNDEWDYKTGISYASSEAESELGSGYHFTAMLADAIGSGAVSPFLLPGESQTQAGLDAIDAASAEGVVLFGGKTTMLQIDGLISGSSGWELDGGEVMVAAGFDFRREGYEFNGDRRAANSRMEIYGAPFDDSNALDDVERDIKALFVEALVPITYDFEVNLAVRYDRYDGFGGTTNPKISAKYNVTDDFMVRGAFSTGFRVPSFNQLFNGVREEPYTGLDFADPANCPGGEVNPNDPNCDEPLQPTMIFGGKEDLGPEESEQSNVGFVFTPTDSATFSADYWEIKKEGTIQTLSFDELIDNFELFPDRFIRDGQGNLVSIDRRWLNAGERETSGVEVNALFNGDLYGGNWNINFNGSYLIEDRKRIIPSEPFGDNLVGTHSRGNIPLRWKHTLAFTYTKGDWTHTLLQAFRDSYLDEVPPGIESGTTRPEGWDPVVSSHTTYNYSVSYVGIDQLELQFGIKNLLDRDPPFTAHQNDFSPGAAFDPRVADPRGRAYTLMARYTF
ncbi:Colicin I receptor [Saliniradius amylolyticus]|uniref:Colicin I receptor n=1 Tax=Saliniradius amylolyticus TaxID=2183582 RepID=A0A2S2E5A3_9ALTE|nr:TonB-dependent receptor [Saliniradius amylolyticus]AWL12838.1 Colicin I receptor [Saliniradius amylolyticus]